MAYWLDEAWHRWPETAEAGTAAAGLYSRCGSYIADCGTDGFVPSAIARMYGTPEWIQRLVEVGLWAVEEKGFRDLRYFPLNRTAAEVERRKKGAAKRQAAYATRKKLTQPSRVSKTSDDASLTRPPSPTPTGKGRARGGLTPVPKWCGRCHPDTRMYVGEDDAYYPCPTCHPGAKGASA